MWINREDLDFGLVRTSALLAVLAVVLSACAGNGEDPPGTSTDGSPDPGATTQARGDELVVALETFGNESPWPWEVSLTAKRLWDVIADPMIARNPETWELEPGLVTEWEHNEDFTTWTFHLREGVMFHDDWGEFTSEDVVYAVEGNLDPEATGGSTGFFRTRLDSVEAPGPYTVEFTMNSPTWDLPYQFAQDLGYLSSITSMRQVEELGEEEAVLELAGTGPYKYDGPTGDGHRFVAVDDHWRMEPGFEELTVRAISDPATVQAGLETGEIDLARVSGDFVALAEQAGLSLQTIENASQYWLVLSGQTTPEREDYCPECPWVGDPDDPDSQENALLVRQALNHAVDRQAIIDGLWQGQGSRDPFAPYVFPHHPEYDSDWAIPEYDPDRARSLLAEAGYPDGFDGLTIAAMVAPSATDGPAVAEAIASDLREVGVEVDLVQSQWETLSGQIRNRATGPASYVYGGIAGDEPAYAYSLTATSTGPFAFVARESTENDQLVSAFLQTTDRDQRADLVHDFAEKLHDDLPVLMIAWKHRTFAVGDAIGQWPALENFAFESRLQAVRP